MTVDELTKTIDILAGQGNQVDCGGQLKDILLAIVGDPSILAPTVEVGQQFSGQEGFRLARTPYIREGRNIFTKVSLCPESLFTFMENTFKDNYENVLALECLYCIGGQYSDQGLTSGTVLGLVLLVGGGYKLLEYEV